MTEVVEGAVNREAMVPIVCFVGGLAGGIGAGYALAKRNLEVKYAALANEEIAEMREHYRNAKAIVAEPKPDLQEVVEELGYVPAETMVIQNPVTDELMPAEVVEVNPEEVSNVFEEAQSDEDWDWGITESRTEVAPYILHHSEFALNEREYDQITLTYFESDDVLCDERDVVIDDREEMIGSELLEKFGYGSGDNNVLYVRNPVREVDVEIVKSSGSYAEEVHGFIQHNEVYRRPRVRRGFDDDEIT